MKKKENDKKNHDKSLLNDTKSIYYAMFLLR